MSARVRVLVVDDKRHIGNLFEFTLGYHGHHVVYAESAVEALESLEKEEFDIAFVDIVMPSSDGITLLKQMKEIAPDLPIIMMTGYPVQEKEDESRRLGAFLCMKKPFELDDVREIVRNALGKEI